MYKFPLEGILSCSVSTIKLTLCKRVKVDGGKDFKKKRTFKAELNKEQIFGQAVD